MNRPNINLIFRKIKTAINYSINNRSERLHSIQDDALINSLTSRLGASLRPGPV